MFRRKPRLETGRKKRGGREEEEKRKRREESGRNGVGGGWEEKGGGKDPEGLDWALERPLPMLALFF